MTTIDEVREIMRVKGFVLSSTNTVDGNGVEVWGPPPEAQEKPVILVLCRGPIAKIFAEVRGGVDELKTL